MNNIYSVSNIVENVKDIINNNFNFNINIQGEISNFKIYKKQNLYLTLKDRESSINVVFFNFTEKSNIILYDGCKIVVNGLLRLNKKNSYINLYANKIQLFGMGELKEEEENLKKYYMAKGYFDKKNKKTLPDNINNIGLITSVDGAALHDFKKTLITNGYKGNVFVKGCYSQGKKCPSSVADAILFFEDFKYNNDKIDIIVLTRGGGSYEDLFGFSNKIIIEAIHNSNICIISAIGHETDTTIIDLVSDLRASTPTAAAEKATPVRFELIEKIKNLQLRLNTKVNSQIQSKKENYEYLNKFLKSPSLIVNNFKEKLLDDFKNLTLSIENKFSISKLNLLNLGKSIVSPDSSINLKQTKINNLSKNLNLNIANNYKDKLEKYKSNIRLLNSNSISSNLKKGYSILMDKKKIVKTSKKITTDDQLSVKLIDGTIDIKVTKIN